MLREPYDLGAKIGRQLTLTASIGIALLIFGLIETELRKALADDELLLCV